MYDGPVKGRVLKRILIVDDNSDIRKAVKESLSLDYSTDEACNGEEAIEKLAANPFDLVTLDLNMPVTNGWECLRVIKDEDNGWAYLKVIIVTVNKEPESVLKAWSLGASYYLTKPFSTTVLLELIRKTLFMPKKEAA